MAIDAFDWTLARSALDPYAGAAPRQGVCVLMAEIEEGQNADQGKAREWLGRAVRAPRDPAWTADGLALDEWMPVSPISGKFDVFEWRVPAEVGAKPAPGLADKSAAPADAPALPASAEPGDQSRQNVSATPAASR